MSGAVAVDAVTDLWGRIIEQAERLGPADWARPTPCNAWDVRDLLSHLGAAQLGFDRDLDLQPPEGWEPPAGAAPLHAWTARMVAARRDWEPARVLAELHEARDAHRERIVAVDDWDRPTPGPTGETTEAGLLQVRLFDLWVHLQDLRLAIGEPAEVADPSLAALEAHRYVVDRVPWMAARRCRFPDGSAVGISLAPPLAFTSVVEVTGGRGRWNADADPAGDEVVAVPGAFTLLTTGRRTAEEWRAIGDLAWEGPGGATFVSTARLF